MPATSQALSSTNAEALRANETVTLAARITSSSDLKFPGRILKLSCSKRTICSVSNSPRLIFLSSQ